MKNSRLRKYLEQKAGKKSGNISADNEKNPEKHTNQDFRGYPDAPAQEEMINPKTDQQKKVAALDSKDGEKIIDPQSNKKAGPPATKPGEERSDGSANAFDATERVQEDE
jgi:hypothetical protein